MNTLIAFAFSQIQQRNWRARVVTLYVDCPTCEGKETFEVENLRGLSSASVNQVFAEVDCRRCVNGKIEVERCIYCGAEPYYSRDLGDCCDCETAAPMLPPAFKRGDHVVDVYGGTDYGFFFVEPAPGIPGMIILQNRSGSICVDASEYKRAA